MEPGWIARPHMYVAVRASCYCWANNAGQHRSYSKTIQLSNLDGKEWVTVGVNQPTDCNDTAERTVCANITTAMWPNALDSFSSLE